MSLISAGSRETQAVPPGRVMTLVCTGTARLWGYPESVGAGQAVLLASLTAGTKTYGPFLTLQRYEVECLTGSVDASIGSADQGATEGQVTRGVGDVGARVAVGCGDSIIAGTVGGGSPYSVAVRKNPAIRNGGLFAVGGTRTDQILGQLDAAAATGARILVCNGGVNDIAQSVPEDTLRTNWLAIAARARALGVRLIDVGMPPTNTSGNVARYVAHDIWRSLYCYKNGIQRADIWTPLATGAGAFRSGLNADAVHPNAPGAILAAPSISAAIADPLASAPPLLAMTDTGSQANTWISNAISWAGVGATPDGTFSIGTGGSYSVTAADSGDLGAWLRVTMTAGTDVGFQMTAVTLASLGWAIGDRLAIGFRARTSGATGVAVSCFLTGITTSSVQPLFADNFDNLTHYSEVVIDGGTLINIRWYASGTGWFEINRPIVVNLTRLGLV